MKKYLFLLLLGFFFLVPKVHAAVTLISTTTASSSATATGTSPAFDTTGANFFVAVTGELGGTSATSVAVSDNMGNVYHYLNNYVVSGDNSVTLFYSWNPTISSTLKVSEKGADPPGVNLPPILAEVSLELKIVRPRQYSGDAVPRVAATR